MHNTEESSLSPRQAEIARLVVSGKSTREIALALTLSPRTVETHIAAIYNKYGVNSRAELINLVLAPGDDGRSGTSMLEPNEVTTNLPLRRTSLVGRHTDIETIVRILRTKQLVTITGAGGIGKTEAALAVGEALLGSVSGGVWLVELAALAYGSPLEDAVARSLSVDAPKNRAVIDAIVAHVQRKTLLLIIDNCEHVIGESAALADVLLRRCPGLQILATSREPLRIAGEHTYRLPSLPVPSREACAGLRAADESHYPAIELFTQRALAVNCSFALDDATMPIVAEMCRRLDGIPLAIELAAARVKVLSLNALATNIESHLRVLAGGSRLALPRHQTMHALIDWSYELLAPAEQRLFECLSVFTGGCRLEEAAAVYGDETDGGFDVLDLLASLVDKSLLVVNNDLSEPRYWLLQTFAQYALEKLDSRGESSAVRQRHAVVYALVAERLEQAYDCVPIRQTYEHGAAEFENFVSALDWALDQRQDVVLGQRMVAAMRPLWINTGAGQRWLRTARELVNERTPPLLAAGLDFVAGCLAFDVGNYKVCSETAAPLIATFGELGEPMLAAYAQTYVAYSLVLLGRAAEAEPLIAPALEVARRHERASIVAFLLRAGANIDSRSGNLRGSRAKLAEALAIYERIGADRQATTMLASLAELEFRAGNVEQAVELATRCLTIERSAQLWRHLLITLANLAAYSVALQRYELARTYSRDALHLAQEQQHVLALISALQHLAAAALLSTTDTADTRAAPTETAATTRVCGVARLLGYVDARFVDLGAAREYTEQQEYDRVLAALRSSLPDDALRQWLAEGSAFTPDQAIELALSI